MRTLKKLRHKRTFRKHKMKYSNIKYDTRKQRILRLKKVNCSPKPKDELNDFEFMFQLMPIRHTHQLYHVKFVLNETWKRLELNKHNQFIKKFLIASYERYIKCTKETNIIKYIESDIVFFNDEILDNISSKSNEVSFNYKSSIKLDYLYKCMDEFIKTNIIIHTIS